MSWMFSRIVSEFAPFLRNILTKKVCEIIALNYSLDQKVRQHILFFEITTRKVTIF
jgi:hypothetical protein